MRNAKCFFLQSKRPLGSCQTLQLSILLCIFMSTKEEFQTLLGQNLRRLRRYKNYTVEDLGLESGLGYSQVSRIELGKRNPTAYTLLILSKSLDVCPSEFFKSINEVGSDHVQRRTVLVRPQIPIPPYVLLKIFFVNL